MGCCDCTYYLASIISRLAPWQMALLSGAIFFSIEFLSSIMSPRIFKVVSLLDKIKRRDFNERIVSTVHATLLLFGSTRVVYNLKDFGYSLATYIFHMSIPADLHNGLIPTIYQLALLYMSLSVGYFIWDLTLCIRDFKRMGIAFTIHALFGVFSLGIPLLVSPHGPQGVPHVERLVYYGCCVFLFEYSTPFLNIRTFLYNKGLGSSTIYAINNAVFALMFMLSRIVYGIPLCLSMALWTYHQHFPIYIRYIMISAPLASMTLNTLWFKSIVGAVGRGGGDKTVRPKQT